MKKKLLTGMLAFILLFSLMTVNGFANEVTTEYDDYISYVNNLYSDRDFYFFKADGIEEIMSFEEFKEGIDREIAEQLEIDELLANTEESEPGYIPPFMPFVFRTATKFCGSWYNMTATYNCIAGNPNTVTSVSNVTVKPTLQGAAFGYGYQLSSWSKQNLDSNRTLRITTTGLKFTPQGGVGHCKLVAEFGYIS